MGTIITDRLALVIDAATGGAVTAIEQVAAASTKQATAQERAALATANFTKAIDQQALSQAKLSLAQAKETGDAAAIATAQDAVSVATKKAAVSKAEAAVAANDLAVADLKASAAATELGATSGVAGGLLASLGVEGGGALAVLSAGLLKLGPLVAAVLGAKLLVDGVKQFVALGSQIHEFQLVTGASATEASQLVGQLKDLGIDPDVAARAMARLGSSIGDGTTKLGQFGIEVAHNADGTTNLAATFENLRKAYNDSTDAATRDAIAKQVGLRGAAQLAPLLALNTEQIKQLNAATAQRGDIFSQQDINNARDLAIAGQETKDALQGLEIELAKGLAPALVTAANAAQSFFSFLGKAWHVADDVAFSVEHLTQKISGHKNASADDAQSQARLQAALEVTQADTDKLTASLTSEVDAQKSVRDGTQALTDAKQNEIDATKTLSDLLAKGAVDQTAVASAQKELASASDEVTRAETSETRAQEALNTARQKATALDLAEAQSKIALAGDKIGQAQAAEQQAKEKLDALLGSGTASAGEIAGAQADLKAAHDNVTQAILDQQQASVDLQKTKQKGTDQDPSVVQAEQSVADAHLSVLDAVGRRSDAEAALRKAETPDPNFQSEVAKATNDVARAHQAVADAQTNQVTQALNLSKATADLAGAQNADAQSLVAVNAQLAGLQANGLNVDAFYAALGELATSALPFEFQADQAGARGVAGLSFAQLAGRRAGGGDVDAYGDYLVGEKGPEILRLGAVGGTVIPNTAGTVIHYAPVHHIVGGSNVSQLAQEITREEAWSIRTTLLPHIAGRS